MDAWSRYGELRRDETFGPFPRAAEKRAVEKMSAPENPHRVLRLTARSRLWLMDHAHSLPIPHRRELAEAVATDALCATTGTKHIKAP